MVIEGKFFINIDWVGGWIVCVIVDGYLLELILMEVFLIGVDILDFIIWFKCSLFVCGVVFDYEGYLVVRVKVFVVGLFCFNLVEGEVRDNFDGEIDVSVKFVFIDDEG